MFKRLRFFLQFLRVFVGYALHIREVLGSLFLLIAFAGFAFSKIEGVALGDSLYFAFVTALSVGYGDITPKTTAGKLVSVGIGLMGILFVGLTAAVATRALADTAKRHIKRSN